MSGNRSGARRPGWPVSRPAKPGSRPGGSAGLPVPRPAKPGCWPGGSAGQPVPRPAGTGPQAGWFGQQTGSQAGSAGPQAGHSAGKHQHARPAPRPAKPAYRPGTQFSNGYFSTRAIKASPPSSGQVARPELKHPIVASSRNMRSPNPSTQTC
jgi:hypothetical protein